MDIEKIEIIKHEQFNEILLLDNDFFNFFNEVNELKALTNKFKSIANKQYNNLGYFDKILDRKDKTNEEISKQAIHKLLGDLWEIFSELFFKCLGSDNRICVFNYKPYPSKDDNGVDGYGIGVDNKPLTVQCKFRGDITYELVERDIKQFAFQSIALHNVDMNTTTNMVVFTNCKGLHYHTHQKVFLNKLRVINGNDIKSLVDNNATFWNMVNYYINHNIKLLEE